MASESDFSGYLESIRTAIYGRQVRSAIVDALSVAVGKGNSLINLIAPAYSNGHSYQVGDYVTHDGKLYKFTATYSGNSWDSSKVQESTVIEALQNVDNSDIVNDILEIVTGTFDPSEEYNTNDYVFGPDGKLYRIESYHATGVSWANTSKTENPVTIMGEISDMKYVPIGFTNFEITPSIAERGYVVQYVDIDYTLNKKPKTLTRTSPTNATLTPNASGTSIRFTPASNFTMSTSSAGRTITFKAFDERNQEATGTKTLYFYDRVYYGTGTVANGFTSAFVKALSNNVLDGKKARTLNNFNVGSGKYAYYAVPKSISGYKNCAFTYNGFTGGFSYKETIQVEITENYSQEYCVYRSDNTNLGTIKLEII